MHFSKCQGPVVCKINFGSSKVSSKKLKELLYEANIKCYGYQQRAKSAVLLLPFGS